MDINEITEKIIGCAIEVHRQLGPGLLESTYFNALCIELELKNLQFQRQPNIPVSYKGCAIGTYRPDLLVEEAVIVEIKSVDRFDPVFAAQVLTYIRAANVRVGLLINFNSRLLKDGLRRYIV